jgi:hypothetical protein
MASISQSADGTARRESHHLVVLVHGTWGRGVRPFLTDVAAWCADGSEMRRAVQSALGHLTQFVPFAWSGANSASGRMRAAEILRERLQLLRDGNPNACIHVVAHSHGGNVVLYALKKMSEDAKISSFVFLSTPFIHVVPRSLHPLLQRRLAAANALLLMPVLGFPWKLFPSHLSMLDAVLFLAIPYLLYRAFIFFYGRARSYAAKFELPSQLPSATLILRSAADEAGAAILAAQFFSTLLGRVQKVVLMIIGDLLDFSDGTGERERLNTSTPFRFKARRILLLLFVAAFLIPIALQLVLPRLPDPTEWLVNLAYWAALALTVCALLLPLLSVALGVCVAAFGPGFAFASSGLNISAEATPPGEWKVVQLALPGDSTYERQRIQHSTHSDPNALAFLEQWLRSVSK